MRKSAFQTVAVLFLVLMGAGLPGVAQDSPTGSPEERAKLETAYQSAKKKWKNALTQKLDPEERKKQDRNYLSTLSAYQRHLNRFQPEKAASLIKNLKAEQQGVYREQQRRKILDRAHQVRRTREENKAEAREVLKKLKVLREEHSKAEANSRAASAALKRIKESRQQDRNRRKYEELAKEAADAEARLQLSQIKLPDLESRFKSCKVQEQAFVKELARLQESLEKFDAPKKKR